MKRNSKTRSLQIQRKAYFEIENGIGGVFIFDMKTGRMFSYPDNLVKLNKVRVPLKRYRKLSHKENRNVDA